MKTKLFLLTALLISQFLISQELFFKAGKNFTDYNYKNSFGKTVSGLQGTSGSNYEFGILFCLNPSKDSVSVGIKSKYLYSLSLSYNQFNARGGNVNNTYSWNTNYLGIQNVVYISAFTSSKGYYNLKFKTGVNASTLLSGQQYINNVVYDLKKYSEFKGLFVQPLIGMDFRLEVSRKLSLNLGYSFSKAFNVSNKSSEKLSFTTNQIQLGIIHSLK